MEAPLRRLDCSCNSYEWGIVGSRSAAAKFAAATNFKFEPGKPYAELWMGTHPSLPSKDYITGRNLLDILQEHKSWMTIEIHRRYSDKLPFLFKVLSISKALSIQAHPNKKLAEQLHASDPTHYPDDNHKPEMAIALSAFDGLCGFRPLAEVAHFLKTIPPFANIIGETATARFLSMVSEESSPGEQKKVLQEAFTSLMKTATSDKSALSSETNELIRLAAKEGGDFAHGGGPSPSDGQELSDLVQRLNAEFPGDVGLFVMFFLNYVKLKPGEAMYLRADDIHAYLSGEIMECMASSDNVVRAGFTPKFKDVDTLTSMLTYNFAPISDQKMKPTAFDRVDLDRAATNTGSTVLLYDPPIEEFSVIKTDLGGVGTADFEMFKGPSIVICTGGRGTIKVGNKLEMMETGYIYFVGAWVQMALSNLGEQRFVTFRAFCELDEKPQGSL